MVSGVALRCGATAWPATAVCRRVLAPVSLVAVSATRPTRAPCVTLRSWRPTGASAIGAGRLRALPEPSLVGRLVMSARSCHARKGDAVSVFLLDDVSYCAAIAPRRRAVTAPRDWSILVRASMTLRHGYPAFPARFFGGDGETPIPLLPYRQREALRCSRALAAHAPHCLRCVRINSPCCVMVR